MRAGARATSPASSGEDAVVFVIDDDALVREALISLFRSVGLQVEAFASATELLASRLPTIPGCLVVDIRLPRLSGFDLQTQLRGSGVMIPIIFITAHGDIPMSVQAMRAGAINFLTKPFRDQEMLDAVTEAIERDRKRLSEDKSSSEDRARFASLTRRERQVMAWVTGGLMNKQIAAKMGITEPTVKIHRGHVMQKMHAKSLADLVLMAERLGIRGREEPEAELS